MPQPQDPTMPPQPAAGASKEFQQDGVTRMRQLYEMEQKRVPDPRPDQVQRPKIAQQADNFVTSFLSRNEGVLDTVKQFYTPPLGGLTSPLHTAAAAAAETQPAVRAPDRASGQYADFGPADALDVAKSAIQSPQFRDLPPETAARIQELTRIIEQPDGSEA